MDYMQKSIERHLEAVRSFERECLPVLSTAAEHCVAALKVGKKIMTAGNGGSAADAQHFAAELVGRYLKERSSLPALALTTDTSALTAIGNDYGYDDVFSRQVEGLANDGDVLILISTSGNSTNLVKAALSAKQRGCSTIALLGKDGGVLKDQVDHAIVVPEQRTPHIQEVHLMIIHILCEYIEENLFPGA